MNAGCRPSERACLLGHGQGELLVSSTAAEGGGRLLGIRGDAQGTLTILP